MVTPIGVFYDDEPPRCQIKTCTATRLAKVPLTTGGETLIMYLCRKHLNEMKKILEADIAIRGR
jgi:hypothetical protein